MIISVNPDLDFRSIREELQENGFVVIKDYMNPQLAEEIYKCLVEEVEWRLFSSNFPEDLTQEQQDSMSPEEREKLIPKRSHNYAEDPEHFRTVQCRFNIKKYLDSGAYVPELLHKFFKALNDPAYLEVMTKLTGSSEVGGVGCAPSWYKPGHFVTGHRDHGPMRIATHLFTLSKNWQKGWGGQFTICDNWGSIKISVEPSFNTLLLADPALLHYVSEVSQEATSRRLTMYGWVQKHNAYTKIYTKK